MSAEPLTKEEKAWLKKLEKVMKSCPSDRIECFNTGDPMLNFFDKNVYEKFMDGKDSRDERDVCIDVHNSGAELASVSANFGIVSSAG